MLFGGGAARSVCSWFDWRARWDTKEMKKGRRRPLKAVDGPRLSRLHIDLSASIEQECVI
jgi:hypothetical protein